MLSTPLRSGSFLVHVARQLLFFFFFFNDTATTEIYTLSLHDALPICRASPRRPRPARCARPRRGRSARAAARTPPPRRAPRSEEHTSELQSQSNLVCRLLLEKKKKKCTSKHRCSLTYRNLMKLLVAD